MDLTPTETMLVLHFRLLNADAAETAALYMQFASENPVLAKPIMPEPKLRLVVSKGAQ